MIDRTVRTVRHLADAMPRMAATTLAQIAIFLSAAMVLGVFFFSDAEAATDWWSVDSNNAYDAGTRGKTVEQHLSTDQEFKLWAQDPDMIYENQGDRIEAEQVVVPAVKTVKLNNLVPPILFPLGVADIPDNYIKQLRSVLDNMRDKENVRLHFVGHTDNLQLFGAVKEQFGDNIGLSRERAGTTAEYFQTALELPPEAISYEGVGESQPVASNSTEEGRAQNRRVEVEVWYDVIGEKEAEREVVVSSDVNRIKVCRTETVCKLRYKDGHSHRARIKNLIPPLNYDRGMIKVPEDYLENISRALHNLGNKQNIVVKFTAYTDAGALEGRDKRIYGNHAGMSKAVALRAALAAKDSLGLANEAIASEGLGATRPIASNDTEMGRSLNRRVEVEFWYDDPLQDLPDEPRLCPDAAGAETITRVYQSPSGSIPPIIFQNGKPFVPNGYTDRLQKVMDEIPDKDNVRLRFLGYANNERMDRRNAAIYGDDIGWSTARAHRTLLAVTEQMGLDKNLMDFEGRGYVQSDDVVNTGFIESETSRVEVQVVYDELFPLDDYEGVEVTRLNREVEPANPFGLNLMRITVDGKPLDDPGKSIPDVQRCTDVALDQAKIQFKHDGLSIKPRLNVTAWPRSVRYRDVAETEMIEDLVRFRLYTNYHSFIERAEVRIFTEQQSVNDNPLAVIEMDSDGMAQWQVGQATFSAPVLQLKYLVRVYDQEGHFDETQPQPLWVVDDQVPMSEDADPDQELLVGYGETRLARQNIPISGGTVSAQGSAIPEGHDVWMAGLKVPVDHNGRFIVEEILPDGAHTVEVAVLDHAGNGELFLRDLELKKRDWFYVGIADLTLSENNTGNDGKRLAPDNENYNDGANLDGRFAFYTRGQLGDGWELKSSADTHEGPIDDIFSNFLDKSPEALFRRIDPKYHYPTFGDDSTVTDDAPTDGKFYLRVDKEKNYALWGNFDVAYTDNEMAQVNRGLYGGNLHYQTLDSTSFGEERLVADGFAADPGTVAGLDELQGTGGSLYYLRHQDILTGSDRLQVEIRDKDTGMVLGVKYLTPSLDYTIDYLQGRILLTQPLETTVDDELLVRSDTLSGNPVFLVARYEFTPGVDDLDTMATGGQVEYWVNDHLKVGVTASHAKEEDEDNDLYGTNMTLRKSEETWVKVGAGYSEGVGGFISESNDGGYDFNTPVFVGGQKMDATAYRVDTSIGVKDLIENGRGRFTLYYLDAEAGYMGTGLIPGRDITQYGGTASLPVLPWLNMNFKGDKSEEQDGLETTAAEFDVSAKFMTRWTLSTGIRHDTRDDNSPVVPLTQQEGDRTDAVIQLGYDSLSRWTAYTFAQGTLRTTGNRDDNFRAGAGGSYQLTERFNVNGELSGGDHGAAGRVGTEYLYSDRTTLYLNYTLENERTDNGVRARKGNLTSGFRTRYSDSLSMYAEERYTHGDVPTGLMHSTGVDLAPNDRLNLGGNVDFGTLREYQTGAELKRTAASVRAGYNFDKLILASALEYRVDDAEQPDTSTFKRTTWLVKFDLKYQVFEDWRLISKLNYANSDSSEGSYYNGEFTEVILGYAFRPVNNDRLNALAKYTYFYNLPAYQQVSTLDSGAGVMQRSHIASIDVTYELSQRWALGGKYAYRLGQVSLDRENPDYFDSNAHLGIVRLDWHVMRRWDAMIEGRMLDLPDADDRKTGTVLAIYRHIGENIKLGVGYSFSKFSDDLTDYDYDHQGLFINLIGKI
jgi:flagellar motor protein MotB